MAHAALTDADRVRIAQAVGAAEADTAGEIYVVVARAADAHHAPALVWAALLALLLAWPLYFFTTWPMPWILLAQGGGFIVAALALSLPALRYRVVPGRVATQAAHEAAESIFLAHGVHLTQDRTGVLIYVALAEHRVIVLADAGINAKVHATAWDELSAEIVAAARAGRLGEGLVAAIGRAGRLLAQHVPPRPDDRNELPNRVVEI